MGNDQKKKEREVQCLQKTIDAGFKQQGKSRAIISRLASRNFDDRNHERPDFVKLFVDPSKNGPPILVGIEHFHVDKMSTKIKNNKMKSRGIIEQNKGKELYQKYHADAERGNIPKVAYEDLGERIASLLEADYHSSYTTLLESFKYTLSVHLNSVDAYRKNLQSLSRGKYPIELIFLIEIGADFHGLYCFDERGIYKKSDNLMPIFEDLISFMEEKIDPKKVNYIVLCIENELNCGDYKVIAFRTNNIRKELKRQHIRIYEYAGEGLRCFPATICDGNFQIKPDCIATENGATINLSITTSDLNLPEGTLEESIHAQQCIQARKNVIMTSAVYGIVSGAQELAHNGGGSRNCQNLKN